MQTRVLRPAGRGPFPLAIAAPRLRRTGGTWAETYGSCANPDFYRAGLASAQDIVAWQQPVQTFLATFKN
jgi:hypothetical protein